MTTRSASRLSILIAWTWLFALCLCRGAPAVGWDALAAWCELWAWIGLPVAMAAGGLAGRRPASPADDTPNPTPPADPPVSRPHA